MNPSSPSDPGSDTGGSRYSFTSRWQVPAPRERLWSTFDRLLVTDDPFVWWPGLRSHRRSGGDIDVVAVSPVGYRLRFRLHDIVETPMDRVTLSADGDLHGEATMTFVPGDEVRSELEVTWNVSANRSWMRLTQPVLRPLFVLGHDVVMRRGERGLDHWMRTTHPC